MPSTRGMSCRACATRDTLVPVIEKASNWCTKQNHIHNAYATQQTYEKGVPVLSVKGIDDRHNSPSPCLPDEENNEENHRHHHNEEGRDSNSIELDVEKGFDGEEGDKEDENKTNSISPNDDEYEDRDQKEWVSCRDDQVRRAVTNGSYRFIIHWWLVYVLTWKWFVVFLSCLCNSFIFFPLLKEVLIFLHGYNIPLEWAVKKLAQLLANGRLQRLLQCAGLCLWIVFARSVASEVLPVNNQVFQGCYVHSMSLSYIYIYIFNSTTVALCCAICFSLLVFFGGFFWICKCIQRGKQAVHKFF